MAATYKIDREKLWNKLDAANSDLEWIVHYKPRHLNTEAEKQELKAILDEVEENISLAEEYVVVRLYTMEEAHRLDELLDNIDKGLRSANLYIREHSRVYGNFAEEDDKSRYEIKLSPRVAAEQEKIRQMEAFMAEQRLI